MNPYFHATPNWVLEVIPPLLNITLLPESFQQKIEIRTCPIPGVESDCWVWLTSLNQGGYGRVDYSGKRGRMAHKVVYELLVGPIPEGLNIDHLCRVTACVYPGHLEPVTQKENLARGLGVGVFNAAKTHCLNGHEFTHKNTMILPRGRRFCRACGIARNKAYMERKAVAQ